MTSDLRHRLAALLDVLQQSHNINRSTASRIVGEQIGLGWRITQNIAMGAYRHRRPFVADGYLAKLAPLEAKYALPLRYRTQYLESCKRHAFDGERAA